MRRAFNKDKVAPRTNIMVEDFKVGRGGGKRAAGGGGRRKAAGGGGGDADGVLRESEEEAAEANAAAKVSFSSSPTMLNRNELSRGGAG